MSETTKYNFYSSVADLKHGDVVKLMDGPFGTGIVIVKQIENGFVTMFRPYGATSDFIHTGGVICYTGIEEYKFTLTDREPLFVYQRNLALK